MNSVVTVFNLIVHRVTVVTSFSLCSCLTRVYLAGRLPKLKLTLSLNRAALAKGKLIKQKKKFKLSAKTRSHNKPPSQN